jgi:hypothetical protein
LRSFVLIKFRFALNINFDRKYYEAKSFKSESRDKSFVLIKFQLALNINLDRKYYKSKLRESNLCMSSQNARKSRSIKNKENLFNFSRKSNNSLSLSTTMKIARMIKRKFVKHVKIFSFSIDMMRDEECFLKEKHHQEEKILQEFYRSICWVFHFKFSELTKKTRLKFKRIQKIQIKNELLKRKKYLLFKMLFNRKAALFWDFIEKDSIRSEISSSMKIRTISHEVWQVFEFQVFKTLMKTIAEIIKNRIKSDVLKLCYEFYRNSWFLVKKKKRKISFDQCRFENESSHHSKCELAFCD